MKIAFDASSEIVLAMLRMPSCEFRSQWTYYTEPPGQSTKDQCRYLSLEVQVPTRVTKQDPASYRIRILLATFLLPRSLSARLTMDFPGAPRYGAIPTSHLEIEARSPPLNSSRHVVVMGGPVDHTTAAMAKKREQQKKRTLTAGVALLLVTAVVASSHLGTSGSLADMDGSRSSIRSEQEDGKLDSAPPVAADATHANINEGQAGQGPRVWRRRVVEAARGGHQGLESPLRARQARGDPEAGVPRLHRQGVCGRDPKGAQGGRGQPGAEHGVG